jgi:hypothetical protein
MMSFFLQASNWSKKYAFITFVALFGSFRPFPPKRFIVKWVQMGWWWWGEMGLKNSMVPHALHPSHVHVWAQGAGVAPPK